jgi:hypothetical protein
MQFLEISLDFGILGFSKILGFFQRFFGIFDVVYEDFQSNLPLWCFNVRASLVWFNDYTDSESHKMIPTLITTTAFFFVDLV